MSYNTLNEITKKNYKEFRSNINQIKKRFFYIHFLESMRLVTRFYFAKPYNSKNEFDYIPNLCIYILFLRNYTKYRLFLI